MLSIRKCIFLCLMSVVFAPLTMAAKGDIEGNYACEGFDPLKNKPYKATAKVTKGKEKGLYHFTWQCEDDLNCKGVGIHEEQNKNLIAVSAICPDDPQYTGIQIYHIQKDGTLEGSWATVDESALGNETCKKVD